MFETNEGNMVYNLLYNKLNKINAENANVSKLNAILFTIHAEKMANIISKKFNIKYTALNYYKEKFSLNANNDQHSLLKYNQFVGENSLTRDSLRLVEAKKMSENFSNMSDIWKKTGWFQGFDYKWRYEIPDNIDKINFSLFNFVEVARLGQIYNNDKLYNAYPFLYDTPVMIKSLENKTFGLVAKFKDCDSFYSKEITHGIILNKNILNMQNTYEDLKSTLLHEIQHIIQERENFAIGGDEKLAQKIKDISDIDDAYKEQFKKIYMNTKSDKDSFTVLQALSQLSEMQEENPVLYNRVYKYFSLKDIDVYSVYKNLGGEQEARLTATRAINKDNKMPLVHDNKSIIISREEQKLYYNISDINTKNIGGDINLLDNGTRVINLYKQSNESTFLHEMSHMFLMDLKEMARYDKQSKIDIDIVNNWAEWKENEDYKIFLNTPFEEEFKQRHIAILRAKTSGNKELFYKLKEEWKHERFARGFEIYIKEEKAPTKELNNVFNKFKKYLNRIYDNYLSVGYKPSKSVKNIMDKMITTDISLEIFIDNKINEGKSDRAIKKLCLDKNFTELKKQSTTQKIKLLNSYIKNSHKKNSLSR